MNDWKAGDLISRPAGIVRHWGVVVGADESGTLCVVHGSKDAQKVVCEPLVTFAADRPLRLEKRAPEGQEQAVVQRAMSMLGQRWNLFEQNCEHVARMAHSGVKQSLQLQGWGTFGALATGILLLMSQSGSYYDPVVDRRRNRRGQFTR